MPHRGVKGQVDGLPGKDPVRVLDGWIAFFKQVQILSNKGSVREAVSVYDHPAEGISPLDAVGLGFQSGGRRGCLSG